jgi:hypothetical protein
MTVTSWTRGQGRAGQVIRAGKLLGADCRGEQGVDFLGHVQNGADVTLEQRVRIVFRPEPDLDRTVEIRWQELDAFCPSGKSWPRLMVQGAER